MDDPAPPAGLNVIWVKGPSPRAQILGSCPCETWTSHLPSLNLSFRNWKMRSSKPYKVVVSISGKNRRAASSLEPRIHLHLLSAGRWGQQLGLLLPPETGRADLDGGGRRTGCTLQLCPFPSRGLQQVILPF